jgi:hypothetical protein
LRAIITGGTGLIGRALAADLSDDGWDVLVLSRKPTQATGMPNGVRVEGWDARTLQGWGHLADGADAIVNLAGAGIADARWTSSRKRLIRDSRVNAGQAVVQAVQEAPDRPKVVIQSSGIGFYGPRGDDEISENEKVGDDFLSQVCVAWEASTEPLDDLGVRRPIIRTGPVLSADGGALPHMLLPFKLFVGGPLGGGRHWFPWIHIADEVKAIRFLMEHPEATGPFNLSAPNPVTNAEFSKTLGKVMNRPAVVPTPAAALRLVFGEMATVLLNGQRGIPENLLDLGFTFGFTEVEPALLDLLQ